MQLRTSLFRRSGKYGELGCETSRLLHFLNNRLTYGGEVITNLFPPTVEVNDDIGHTRTPQDVVLLCWRICLKLTDSIEFTQVWPVENNGKMKALMQESYFKAIPCMNKLCTLIHELLHNSRSCNLLTIENSLL
jgi:hypothetical protein